MEKPFHSALASTLESQEGTPEEVCFPFISVSSFVLLVLSIAFSVTLRALLGISCVMD